MPKPKAVALGVAVAHRDARRVDAELLVGDLRQRGLEPLAVRLDADHQHHRAVGRMRAVQLSKPGTIEAPRLTNSAAPCAVCSAKAAKPMPIRRAVGLALLLPRAHRRHVEQFGAEPHALRIVAIVEAHAADRGERHLLRPHHVQRPHLDRVAADRAGDLVDRALDRKARPRPADAAIGAERRLVGRDRRGAAPGSSRSCTARAGCAPPSPPPGTAPAATAHRRRHRRRSRHRRRGCGLGRSA